MKNQFFEHFSHDDDAIKKVWINSLFIFDANVLLNLYRYSDSTRDKYIDLLSTLKDRIWVPHQAAYEFFGNRLDVIFEQKSSYEKAVKLIEELKQTLDNSSRHPFVRDDVLKSSFTTFDVLTKQLNESKNAHLNKITSDPVLYQISDLFDNSVGDRFSNEVLEKIITEGEERYNHNIPPGYMDSQKKPSNNSIEERIKKFGDLVVWKELIEKSKSDNKNVIFITDDAKDDWWNKFKGKTIGPRPELIKEFTENTGNIFHMYNSHRFLELAKRYLHQDFNDEMLTEVKDIKTNDIKLEVVNHENISNDIDNLYTNMHDYSLYMQKKLVLEQRLKRLSSELEYIEEVLVEAISTGNLNHLNEHEKAEMIKNYEIQRQQLRAEFVYVNKDITKCEKFINVYEKGRQ